MAKATYIALGSNLSGLWGAPKEILERTLQEINRLGCELVAVSPTYQSASLSPGQPPYLNLVLACRSSLAPAQLLRLAKAIERRAGRRPRAKWGARTLDIDIIMHGSQPLNWPRRSHGSLTLPHPESHKRAFVLKPLCDVAPHWQHPALRVAAATLLRRLPQAVRRAVRQI